MAREDKAAKRDREASKPLPTGFSVSARKDGAFGVHWFVRTPLGVVYRSRGAFYDGHDVPGESAQTAAEAWGRVAIHRRTFATHGVRMSFNLGKLSCLSF